MRDNLEGKKRILKRRITKEKEQNVIASMKVKKEQLRKYEKEGKLYVIILMMEKGTFKKRGQRKKKKKSVTTLMILKKGK